MQKIVNIWIYTVEEFLVWKVENNETNLTTFHINISVDAEIWFFIIDNWLLSSCSTFYL